MPIDNCAYTFDQLATSVLPNHFERLEGAIRSPIVAEAFVGHKSATKALLSHAGFASDFPGCYVFIDVGKPVYVGISRGVINRLVQHLSVDSAGT